MTISEFLKKHQGDLSMYRIAQETGISQTQIANYFKGTHEPSANKFFMIVKVLNIDLKHLTEFVVLITKINSK